jgi:hypothetical protein
MGAEDPPKAFFGRASNAPMAWPGPEPLLSHGSRAVTFADAFQGGGAYTFRMAIAKTGDEVYLDEPYLSIRWRSIPQILYAEWKGFATSPEFRSALLTGVRAIRERHVIGYVSDARKAKVVLAEDEEWARKVWLPQAVTAGLKRMAIVTASAGLGKMAYDDAARAMDSHGLSMRTFDSVPTAMTWALTGLKSSAV